MAKKAFEVQGSLLSIGGSNLEVAANGNMVIPGVTRAATAIAREVEEFDWDQEVTYSAAPVVIDAYRWLVLTGTSPEAGWSTAEYQATLDDDSYIDEIAIASGGTAYTGVVETVCTDNMFAYIGAEIDPFASFVADDWVVIPFYVRCGAGDIEQDDNYFGGGSGNTGDVTFSNSIVQGAEWELGLSPDGEFTEDNKYFRIRGGDQPSHLHFDTTDNSQYDMYLGNDGKYVRLSKDGEIVIGVDGAYEWDIESGKRWTFETHGGLTFPDGTVQTTAYTGESGSVNSAFYVAVNTDGRSFTSTNGLYWTEYTTSMAGVGRVAVGPAMIVYSADGVDVSNGDGDALWYASTDTPGTVTEVTGLLNITINQVKYFTNIAKFVAVGQNDSNLPVILYSSNGIDWTTVDLDSGFLATLNGGYSNTAQFYDIETNGTGFFLITSDNNLGAFYTTDITTSMGASQWIDFSGIGNNVAFSKIAFVAAGSFTGWHIMQNEDDADDAWYYNSNTNPTTGSFSVFALADVGSEFANEINYEPSMSEVVFGEYNSTTTIMIATGDGQILYWPAVENGPWVSIPKPYTATDFDITLSSTATITFGTKTAKTNEKIVLSNCTPSGYNGTYYVGINDFLYTTSDMGTAFDSSGLASFESGTLTFSHGQFIDALHYSNGVFYAGNDDEEMFVSTDGGATWILTESFTGNPGEPEFMNDIDSYVTTSNSDIGDIVVDVSNEYTSLTITDKDFNLITTRTDPGQDADISIESADDVWITANGDDIVLRAASEVRIETNDAIQNWTWEFTTGGVLSLGNDKGAIFANQTSGKVTIADNLGPDGNPPMPSTAIHIGGTDAFVISRGNGSNNPSWTFGDDGKTSLPGALVKSTVAKTGADITANDVFFEVTAVDGLGAVTEITVTNSPNPAWVIGTSGLTLTDVNFTVNVDGSGNATVVVNSSGNGHSVSETFSLPATALGATAPTPTALDLTKSIQKLADGVYSLADGVEGQIIHLVPSPYTNAVTNVQVTVANARSDTGQFSNGYLYPFSYWVGTEQVFTSMCTLIFTDEHWQQTGGGWD